MDLNQIIPESIAGSKDIAEKLADAADAVVAMVDGVKEVMDELETKAKATREGVTALTSRLAEAQKALETAADSAVLDLDAIVTEAAAVEKEVADLLAAVNTSLDALDTACRDAGAKLDEEMDGVERHLDDHDGKVKALSEAIKTDFEASTAELGKFRTTLEEAGKELEEKESALDKEIDELGQAAELAVQDYWLKSNGLVGSQTSLLILMANELVAAHNAAAVALRQSLTEDVTEKLKAADGAVSGALEEVKQECPDRQSALEKPLEALAKGMGEGVTVLAGMQAVLDLSSELA